LHHLVESFLGVKDFKDFSIISVKVFLGVKDWVGRGISIDT
jgi:hypothetical protein